MQLIIVQLRVFFDKLIFKQQSMHFELKTQYKQHIHKFYRDQFPIIPIIW